MLLGWLVDPQLRFISPSHNGGHPIEAKKRPSGVGAKGAMGWLDDKSSPVSTACFFRKSTEILGKKLGCQQKSHLTFLRLAAFVADLPGFCS